MIGPMSYKFVNLSVYVFTFMSVLYSYILHIPAENLMLIIELDCFKKLSQCVRQVTWYFLLWHSKILLN